MSSIADIFYHAKTAREIDAEDADSLVDWVRARPDEYPEWHDSWPLDTWKTFAARAAAVELYIAATRGKAS